MKQPKRRLKEIQIKEVSLVGSPANKKKFLFWKDDGPTKIEIGTDGTHDGTKITVNGDDIENVDSFSFYLYPDRGGDGDCVSCSYSRVVGAEDGFQRTETYYLTKGAILMDEKLKALLKTYFGDEYEFVKMEDQSKVSDTIKSAVDVIKNYKEDMADDLEKAIGTIIECALNSIEPIVRKEEKPTKPDEKPASEDTTKLIKSIEDLGIKLQEAAAKQDEVAKTVKEVSDRLEKVEKADPGSQSINGQDGDDVDNAAEDNFPSIAI